MKRILILIIPGIFLLNRYGIAQDTLDLFPSHPGSLICWSECRQNPRPLKIFYLKVNLLDPELELVSIVGDDPDGNGPAESQLTPPIDLIKKAGALAAINSNAFDGIPNDHVKGFGWYEGRPVDIHGMVVTNGKTISPVEEGRTAFWLSTDRKLYIGNPSDCDSVLVAISDWTSPLLVNDRMVPDSSICTNHPRTGIGFDESNRWLLMMVVDGRQPGYSEGLSLFELASIFHEHGCTSALNLDGGGSSIMMVRETGMEYRTMNRPSDQKHRPIPVMLGVRIKSGSADNLKSK